MFLCDYMIENLNKTINGKIINWDEFSTIYSVKAINQSNSNSISDIAIEVHDYWIKSVYHLWKLLDDGYEVNGGYTKEKRLSHQSLLIPYNKLDIRNKLKDCFVIKKAVSNERWIDMKGYRYDRLFKKYEINWQ